MYIDREPFHQGHPEDILPLVLTSVTQELFGCVADEDVTGESPYKLLKKDNIIKDIKKRAAVSDFSPAKQNVLVRRIEYHTDHSDSNPQDIVVICRQQVKKTYRTSASDLDATRNMQWSHIETHTLRYKTINS